MAIFEDVEPERRVGAGLLFLGIAMGVLVVQPATPMITAVIASTNLLISTIFLITVGRDTTETPAYDVGFWLLAVIVALVMYILTTLLLAGTLYIFQVLAFVIGFGLSLGVLAELRAKLTNHRKR